MKKSSARMKKFSVMDASERKFVAFIMTHGRADNVKTVHTLRNAGYTGRIVFLIDNEDSQSQKYIENFGSDDVYIFDKKKQAGITDTCDNFGKRNNIVFARNASFNIAKELGYTHFAMLEDDYTEFSWNFSQDFKWRKGVHIKNIDKVFDALLDFLDSTPTLSIAIAQGGDFIGGGEARMGQSVGISFGAKRKAMNSFFCRVDRPIEFKGLMNEDVNTYVMYAIRGGLFFTANLARLEQVTTQKSDGGTSELYRSAGTYVKSFYTVMQAPACVKLRLLSTSNPRIHHRIDWTRTTPKILSADYKKALSHGN
jgi:hypothetical protein